MRLIDADKLEKDLMDMAHNELMPDYFRQMCMSMAERVSKEPTIEAGPVIHAHWIPQYVSTRGNTDKFECSNCNALSHTAHMMKICPYKYCQNCGAKMDGKEVTGS